MLLPESGRSYHGEYQGALGAFAGRMEPGAGGPPFKRSAPLSPVISCFSEAHPIEIKLRIKVNITIVIENFIGNPDETRVSAKLGLFIINSLSQYFCLSSVSCFGTVRGFPPRRPVQESI
jgi:hypothetical protein